MARYSELTNAALEIFIRTTPLEEGRVFVSAIPGLRDRLGDMYQTGQANYTNWNDRTKIRQRKIYHLLMGDEKDLGE